LRLPCFWLGDDVGVLPAFGAFTGMHPIRTDAGDRVFAIADGAVTAMRSRAAAEVGDRCAA
jgi:metallophosphoesterase superfamily enzyme